MSAKTKAARARMRAAQHDLEFAQGALRRDLVPVRAWVRRHRSACIVAGGLLSGFALAALSPRLWGRIGAAFGSSAAILARSVLTPIIAGAVVARQRQAASAAPAGADVNPI